MIQGILFDMDGVLLDSERYIAEAAVKMFAEKGYTVKEEDFIPFIGTGENRYLGGVAEKYHIPFDLEIDKVRTYTIYGEMIKGNIEALPGVFSFMNTCRKRGIKMALATSADKMKMLINLECIGLKTSDFDATVNGLEVVNKKPDPEVFILAANKLGLMPENCLVIEDAINGIAAGKSAGCKCLGLTTSFTAAELSKADWIAQNLADAPAESINW